MARPSDNHAEKTKLLFPVGLMFRLLETIKLDTCACMTMGLTMPDIWGHLYWTTSNLALGRRGKQGGATKSPSSGRWVLVKIPTIRLWSRLVVGTHTSGHTRNERVGHELVGLLGVLVI
jgi:hypothetical protein